MRLCRLEQPISLRLARGVLAVALALGAAAAAAQGVYRHVDTVGHVSFTDRPEMPITQRELEPLPAKVDSAQGIRGRSLHLASHSGLVDRNEANRRLLQAQREFARGPDMQQGIPPTAEKNPGDRRRARVIALQRGVDAAQARAREVNVPGRDGGI